MGGAHYAAKSVWVITPLLITGLEGFGFGSAHKFLYSWMKGIHEKKLNDPIQSGRPVLP